MESILTQNQFTAQLPHRISLSQAARLSGYHQDYLGQLCRLGKLRAVKIGRNWYTTQSELQSLVNSSEAYGNAGLSSSEIVEEMITNAAVGLNQINEQSEELQEFQESIDQPETVERAAAIPVVASNYVISEVEGVPIKLEQRAIANGSHHTLQTLITRMKLDELKTEVLQVTGLIGQISEEVSNHSQILARHEKMLKARADLREFYSPSISVLETKKPVVSVIDFEKEVSSAVEKESADSQLFWLWPALTIVLAIAATGLFIASNNAKRQSEFSTIIYKTVPATSESQVVVEPQNNAQPQVAGEVTTETNISR